MPDREKVINDVEQAIEILSKVEEPTFWLDFVKVAVENALKLLKEQTISGWVSLEDGTPEKKGLYLLIDKYATTIIEYWMDGRWRTVDSDDMPDITHWLLLPALPEEVNEDA